MVTMEVSVLSIFDLDIPVDGCSTGVDTGVIKKEVKSLVEKCLQERYNQSNQQIKHRMSLVGCDGAIPQSERCVVQRINGQIFFVEGDDALSHDLRIAIDKMKMIKQLPSDREMLD